MRCLVTGGAGFIGSHLCHDLLKKGNEVVCLDNLSTGRTENLDFRNDFRNFEFIKGDVNSDDFMALKGKFDLIFHYAATVGVKRTMENPISVLNDINGIKNVFELSRRCDSKLVFASSSEVYGHPVELPEKEDGVLNSRIPYAVIKVVGEKFCESYFSTYGLKTCALRFFNTYGPKQHSSAYGFVVGIFIRQALENKPLTVFGDGKQTRDFTFIEDNVDAAVRAAELKKADGRVINIGTGIKTPILELAQKITDICPGTIEFCKEREGEIRDRQADITNMQEILGFTPKYNLDEGLKKTMEWYKCRK